ncbi:MAG: DUF5683 domain-containing protein [Cytophagales bacterium]|nr:DUF5683 domain-containing protein [Cytophagales bacterium]
MVLILSLCLKNLISLAQSSISKNKSQPTIEEKTENIFQQHPRENPDRALYFSMLLPGAGQVYNGEMWKLPLILGTQLILGTYIYQQNRLHNQFRIAASRIRDADPLSQNPFPGLSSRYIETSADNAERNREILIFASLAVYILQIADAYVAAHLKDFNLSQDLSMTIKPHIQNLNPYPSSLECSWTLNLY